MEKINSCGFGSRRKTQFGDNIGPTTSNFDSFFKNGTANSSNLKSKCLSGFYNQPKLSKFGKAKIYSFEKKDKNDNLKDISYLKKK